jgi:cysteinyl-tRNA synthetase
MKSGLLKSSLKVTEEMQHLKRTIFDLEAQKEARESKEFQEYTSELEVRNQSLENEVEEEFQKSLGLQDALKKKSKIIEGMERLQTNLQETVEQQAKTIEALKRHLDEAFQDKDQDAGKELQSESDELLMEQRRTIAELKSRIYAEREMKNQISYQLYDSNAKSQGDLLKGFIGKKQERPSLLGRVSAMFVFQEEKNNEVEEDHLMVNNNRRRTFQKSASFSVR